MAALYAGEAKDKEPQKAGPWLYVLDYVDTFVPVFGAVKAAGDWQLDVLGIPYGSSANLDTDGQYFDAATALHEDKFPLPPAVYYHGFGPDKTPMGTPEYIGKTVKRWRDTAGEWFRVVLDKGNQYAQRVWDAAQKGVSRASSGSIVHLVRYDQGGHIREWPVVELSIFDAVEGRNPANRYAVAVPVAKAIYKAAGLDLPDFTPEAEPEAGPPAAAAVREDSKKTESTTGGIDVELTEVQKMVSESIAAALKADREATLAAAQFKADQEAAIAAAIKAERATWEAAAAEANRLPGGASARVRRYSTKFDNLTPAEHALVLGILLAPGKGVKPLPSDEAIMSLALKVESEAVRDKGSAAVWGAMKMAGLKADEINRSTLASYGDEWIGILYSRQLWESIRAECWVLNALEPYSDQVPDGFESDIVPLESTDPTWYKVSQAADDSSGRPDVTITSSKVTTAQKAITLAKMGCRVEYTGDLQEDSLINFAANAMRQMKQAGLEQFEHAIIDGDTETASSTNINSIGGAISATATYMLVNGFRKLALVTNTANSRSGGALGDDDFLETVKLMGTVGINADISKCQFILDYPTYWKALQLANVKTKDVWNNATLESGQLRGIWGYPLKPSAFMHYKSAVRMANTAGKVDQTVVANNVCGSILAVRWDQWRLKWKRRMTLETDRWPESDTNQIVAMVRWGLGYRDTEAAAVTYGITGV